MYIFTLLWLLLKFNFFIPTQMFFSLSVVRSVYNMLHYIRITLHVELHKCHVEKKSLESPGGEK